MRHMFFVPHPNLEKLTTAILIKDSSFNQREIQNHYIASLVIDGMAMDEIIAFTLEYDTVKKCKAGTAKSYLATLLPELDKLGITNLYCADPNYFKILTKQTKTAAYHGYVLKCALPGYEHMNVVLGTNYQALVYDPSLSSKLDGSLKTLLNFHHNRYVPPGDGIIQSCEYPTTISAIKDALKRLHQYPELTCDLEGFDLTFYDCGVGTLSFAWDEGNGIAFPVDYGNSDSFVISTIRNLIKNFLSTYKGKIIYHNANFDIKVLVYQLWMLDLEDHIGMQQGIEVLTRNFDCTKIIAYLAINNTVRTDLKLKSLAQDFAGNYAQEDIEDITKIPLDTLLEYNLVDCLSTWYVYNKYKPIMIKEGQQDLYRDLFRKCIITILQMELVGMPVDMEKVLEAQDKLETIVAKHMLYFRGNAEIIKFHEAQKQDMVDRDNMKLKTKKRVLADFDDLLFNPGSDQQLQKLIYEWLDYDIIDRTKNKQPAVGSATLKKLINHAKDPAHVILFENLIGLSKANKVLTSFIPAFLKAKKMKDGTYRLYGNFNLGGTQSGRLSSSKPNLQNIPSGSTYADIIKMCFISPPGWIFCGADFSALEAMVGALLPKDPNKLKVYTDGYDSHCLNAYGYFGKQMPDIIDSITSINSIKDKYPQLRQKSKSPTFALQYFGTYVTVMKSAGVPEDEAKAIEANFHKMYEVSDIWIKKILDKAHEDGHVLGAFGLKIRTPLLKNTIPDTPKMPYAATAERRSAGNAVTQSYGLLNTRAGMEFQERVFASPYRYDILPCAQIHDAIYLLVRDDDRIIKWVNDKLIECMRWDGLPELHHPTVKLGANLELYWPNWKTKVELPNNISRANIHTIAWSHKEKVEELLKAA